VSCADFRTNPIKTLKELAAAETECTRCPLYKNATQVVPGEGLKRARLMLVGEQPGDQEDKQGKPFVGPAGRILSQALDDAGIARGRLMPLPDGGQMLAAIHPSYILRIEDDADKQAQYRQFVADLKVCARALAKTA
jgi:uracil-DNA glycosylase